MANPNAPALSTDMLARLQKDFGTKSDEAAALLTRVLSQGPRVLRCVIALSEADLEQLRSVIDSALQIRGT